MDLLLPLIYVVIFSAIISRIRFFSDAHLPRSFFLSLFVLKAVLGMVYTRMFSGGDTTMYFNQSKLIFQTLWHHPMKYVYLTLGPNGGDIPQFIYPEVMAMGYWGDTSDYMVVRFNAIVRLFSFGNFYVHAVFMAFVSLVGLIWLYRSCVRASGDFSIKTAAIIFLIPSVLFWGSGVHKEGLMLFSLGLFFYGCVRMVQQFSARNLLLVLTGAALTYFTRDYVLFMLLPGVAAFFVTYRRFIRIRFLLPLIYAVVIAGGIYLPLFKGKNVMEVIALKQKEFKALEAGGTQISVRDFQPSCFSLVTNLPQALRNSLLGPFFISPFKVSHYILIAENALLMLALVLFPWIAGKPRLQPFPLMCLLFSVLLLLLIGYIVPNVGAIVRYRSIALPFLFIFLYSGKKSQK